MSIGKYIKSKWVSIIIFIVLVVYQYIFLYMLTKGSYSCLFISGAFVIGFLVALGADYVRKRQYSREVEDLLESIRQKTLIGQMLPATDSPEGELLGEAFEVMGKYMNDEVLKYKIISKEYREYIELWIHEVKTPISAARLIMQNYPYEKSESLDEELGNIEQYVEQALYYARSNSVEKDYMVKGCILSDIVTPVVRRNRRGFILSHIALKIDGLTEEVFTDEKWAQFIISQIIGNAVKYHGDNPEIHIYSERKNNGVALIIRDNGIGIPEKDQQRVFEKGFTGETGRQYQKATGMGLYLAKKLCDKLNHGVSLQSIEGEGTQVTIVFPTSEVEFLRQ